MQRSQLSGNFIFWQIYDDNEEGRKVCSYYNLIGMGQKIGFMRSVEDSQQNRSTRKTQREGIVTHTMHAT